MRIIGYKDIDRAEWSKLVASSATGTWFQSVEAYEFFASMPELFKPFVVGVACDPAGAQTHLRAVCVGYVTVEKDDCINEEVLLLLSTLREQLSTGANAPIYIECRNFNDYSRWKDAFTAAGFDYMPHLNFHVDTSSVEVVEANLGKSRKRDIRTTIREGVSIVLIGDLKLEIGDLEREQKIREFYAILENLYKTKVKTPLFPVEFFLELSKHKDARFLLTELNGKIIGGTVCVEQEGKCLYEWFACGEDGVYSHVFPSCYATYAGIRYAAEHNMPRFDMMGAGKPDEAYGVRDFKAKFGGKEVEHGRFLCVTKPLLYKIGTLGVKILKKLK